MVSQGDLAGHRRLVLVPKCPECLAVLWLLKPQKLFAWVETGNPARGCFLQAFHPSTTNAGHRTRDVSFAARSPGVEIQALAEKSGAQGRRGSEGDVEAEIGAMEEGGEFGEAEREAFGGSGTEGNVAQLAARTRGFSVEVQMRVGDSQDFGGFGKVADKVEHGAVASRSRGAERQSEDGAQMVLELASDGTLDSPVAGIVDARSHFIGLEFALVFEKLDGQH